jgi:outer membrane protein assembly factor BamD (BamD/ComL family)
VVAASGCRGGGSSDATAAAPIPGPDAQLVNGNPAAAAGGSGVQPVGFEQPRDTASADAGPNSEDDIYGTKRFGEARNLTETFSAKKLYEDALTLVGQGPNREIAQVAYREGEAAFAEGDFETAAKRFKTAARRWPDSSLEEDALFWLSESYFFGDRYPDAQDTYTRILDKYDNSRHLDKISSRLFAIGRYWEELDRTDHRFSLLPNLTDKTRPRFDTAGNSESAYEAVHLNDPTGPLADDAIMAQANKHFLDEKYEDADYYYDLLRRDYSKSPHQRTAHELGLQAKLRTYQGAQYDATPLEEAEKLVTQTRINFPGNTPEERNRLAEQQQKVLTAQAERDWEMAEFYCKKKQYGAARMHYQIVIDEYGNTPLGERARQRMLECEGKPATPPQKLPWLVKLFDGKKKTR